MIGGRHGDQEVGEGAPEGVEVGVVLGRHKVVVGRLAVGIQGGDVGDVGVGGEEDCAYHTKGEQVEEEKEENCKDLRERVLYGLGELLHDVGGDEEEERSEEAPQSQGETVTVHVAEERDGDGQVGEREEHSGDVEDKPGFLRQPLPPDEIDLYGGLGHEEQEARAFDTLRRSARRALRQQASVVPVAIVGGDAQRARVLEERQDHYGDYTKASQPLDGTRVVRPVHLEGPLVDLVVDCTVVEGILDEDRALEYRDAAFVRYDWVALHLLLCRMVRLSITIRGRVSRTLLPMACQNSRPDWSKIREVRYW